VWKVVSVLKHIFCLFVYKEYLQVISKYMLYSPSVYRSCFEVTCLLNGVPFILSFHFQMGCKNWKAKLAVGICLEDSNRQTATVGPSFLVVRRIQQNCVCRPLGMVPSRKRPWTFTQYEQDVMPCVSPMFTARMRIHILLKQFRQRPRIHTKRGRKMRPKYKW
jgi:hypothetical protein